jgi:hypothetical protein
MKSVFSVNGGNLLGHLAFANRVAAQCRAKDLMRVALSPSMSEIVTPWKFSIEGEAGSDSDERIGAAPRWAGDRGGGKGDAAAIRGGVQAEYYPGGRRVKTSGAVGAWLRRGSGANWPGRPRSGGPHGGWLIRVKAESSCPENTDLRCPLFIDVRVP